jgi:hypothetical protein
MNKVQISRLALLIGILFPAILNLVAEGLGNPPRVLSLHAQYATLVAVGALVIGKISELSPKRAYTIMTCFLMGIPIGLASGIVLHFCYGVLAGWDPFVDWTVISTQVWIVSIAVSLLLLFWVFGATPQIPTESEEFTELTS